ncbi:hypothetical protein BH23BAC1_BH23BAC1_45730 [soil metagenome]
MVGVGKGAENNILIKDAESLELGHRVNAVVLDKTGTITEGKPIVTDLEWRSEIKNIQEYKKILLAIEVKSEHPLAEAVVNRIKEENPGTAEVEQFTSITGKGVKATLPGQKDYYVGNRRLMEENNIVINSNLNQLAQRFQEQAKTVIYFSNNQEVLAILAIADKIKESSKKAIKNLHERGIEVYKLTGDNEKTATAVADQVGIKHYKAEVLPADKADFVKKLQKTGKLVAMVGDGINDSQALAQADLSIAMGQGSDIAMDVAKITLITSDLQSVPKALQLSRRTVAGIRQNLFWAFIYNLTGIPLAAGILYPINGFLLDPMIAGAAMALSSVSVVTNSLRLKGIKL